MSAMDLLMSVWRYAAYNIAMLKAGDTSEPDAADKDFFQRLRREVERQISGYVYQVHAGAIGTPLPGDYIRALLDAMPLYLVEPCWEEVHICNTPEEIRTGVGVRRMCVTMAEDGSYVLVFDPVDEEYHLAWRSKHGLGTWGVSSLDSCRKIAIALVDRLFRLYVIQRALNQHLFCRSLRHSTHLPHPIVDFPIFARRSVPGKVLAHAIAHQHLPRSLIAKSL